MPNESVKLCTDFSDYSDGEFGKSGIEFQRYRYAGISRKDAFDILNTLGNKTPMYGVPREIIPKIAKKKNTDKFHVVIHLNIYEHSEYNKELVTAQDAFDKYSKHFCVEYLPTNEVVSYRYLKIGSLDFGLIYSSNDKWKSNSGGVEIKIACSGSTPSYDHKLNYPLFSIDYIKSSDELFAIDLDFAPVLKKTGIELVLTPKQVYEEISNAINYFKRKE